MPVLDDVVDRNLPTAQFREGADQLFLRGIALPALPEAEGPFRIERRLAGEVAVTADDLVIGVSREEIEVGLRLELGPEAQAVLLLDAPGCGHHQADVGHAAFGSPENLDGLALPGLEMDLETVAVGVPGRTPAEGHHLFPADRGRLETGIILGEIVVALLGGLQFAFIFHNTAERMDGIVRDYPFVFVIQGILAADHIVTIETTVIKPGQGAFLAVPVVQLEHLPKLLIRLGIAPAAQRIGVEQEAVAPGRHDERNADLRVVLVQFLVLPLVVEFARLLLPEAVEGLVVRRIKDRMDAVRFLSFHLDGLESDPAAFPGGEELLAFRIGKAQFSRGFLDRGLYGGCR